MHCQFLFLIGLSVVVTLPQNPTSLTDLSQSVPPMPPLSLTSTVRFCLKGWQEYKESDCPYGLLFNQPQDLECLFNIGDLKPRMYRHVCEDPFIIPQKQNNFNLPLTQNLEKIGFIDFVNATASHVSNSAAPTVVDWVDMTVCYKECSEDSDESDLLVDSLGDVDSVEESEAEDVLKIISDESRQKLVDQTLRLGDHLFDKLYTLNSPEVEIPSGLELRVVQMFKKTMQILGEMCHHPFLHKDYINRVTYGFLFLVQDFGTHTIEDVTMEEYEDIMDALNFCEQRGAQFRLEGLICPTKALVKNIVKVTEGEELSAKVSVSNDTRYRLDKFDLFIESAWRGIDAVHGMCFATFRPNSNMHHRYQRAMEMLFNEKMQERWVNPTELEKISDWGLWFLVDIQTTMDNLQQCVKAAYEAAPFTVRLDRPIDHRRLRREANRNELNEADDEVADGENEMITDLELPSTQNGLFDERWEEYAESGGITVRLATFITCLKTESQRMETLANLRSTCQIGMDQLI